MANGGKRVHTSAYVGQHRSDTADMTHIWRQLDREQRRKPYSNGHSEDNAPADEPTFPPQMWDSLPLGDLGKGEHFASLVYKNLPNDRWLGKLTPFSTRIPRSAERMVTADKVGDQWLIRHRSHEEGSEEFFAPPGTTTRAIIIAMAAWSRHAVASGATSRQPILHEPGIILITAETRVSNSLTPDQTAAAPRPPSQ